MSAAEQHEQLLKQMAWLDTLTAGLALPADERALMVLGCIDVATEHQAAIALLYKTELYGSAFALLRVLMESVVRGMWLRRCATDSQVAKFKKGDIGRKFGEFIADLEPTLGTTTLFSSLKNRAWTAMNGFTHTGFHQVSRRHSPGKVQPNYSEEDILNLLLTTNMLGAIAYGEVIDMSKNKTIIAEYNAKILMFSGRVQP